MNTKLNKTTALVTGNQIVNSLSALAVGESIQLAENDNWYLVAHPNRFCRGFAVKLELRGGSSYSIAGNLSGEKKPSVDEIITMAEAYIQNVILKTPVYTPPKYATKDAEIAALRNALTLIKSLSTPLNNLSWEASTQPHLPTLVDKISTIAKEAL